ncbi:hypothetical protein ATZ36_11730 [Candidatus Endomicrobiellum trichonymphae]|uniref:Uncharacterized protein n=1 Tax=Endomicrobium trichonymphae TaxID=1408204 RepID=A0A1E5IF56_ENDTX|nr:hypothetical protein ATZ36_11730 [Candidatus Endomicrobium trichonymphae]
MGLVLSAGPGLDPRNFSTDKMNDHMCVMPGGLDHRGMEVESPQPETAAREAEQAAYNLTTKTEKNVSAATQV